MAALIGNVRAGRGSVVVCLDSRGGSRAESLASVLDHTSRDIQILACSSYVGREADLRSERIIHAESIQAAIAMSAPADIAVVSPDCIVAHGWLDALRRAAYADARTATASPITAAEIPVDPSVDFRDAAALALASLARRRPKLPTPSRLCTFVRRSAIELVGGFTSLDDASQSGQFAERCVQRGLIHVLADDVVVSSVVTRGSRAAACGKRSGPVARAIGHARRAVNGLTVTVDARVLDGERDGTAVHVLELLAALGRRERIHVTGIVSSRIGTDVRRELEQLAGVSLVCEADVEGLARADIVHRPFQVASPADLNALARFGERLVITHQDLISYHNPTYFPSHNAWEGYRDMTRRALSLADGVVFFSEHVRGDALAEGLAEPGRTAVIRIGVDHTVTGLRADAAIPAGAEAIPKDTEIVLCLGTDFWHKNRIFALRLLEELTSNRGWQGMLVLAGAHVRFGSSRLEEQQLLAAAPSLARSVVQLPAVTEAEKTWLLRRADLVVYPSVHEGFGLVPFEAADHATPCLWAAGTSLSEILPASAARIVPWDTTETARRTLTLLHDPAARADNIQAIRAAAQDLRWDETAERLTVFYGAICDAPASPETSRVRARGLMRDDLSEDAVRLVGPDGALPRNLERPLLALATHPRVAAPVFTAIKTGYRLSRWWSGRGRASASARTTRERS